MVGSWHLHIEPLPEQANPGQAQAKQLPGPTWHLSEHEHGTVCNAARQQDVPAIRKEGDPHAHKPSEGVLAEPKKDRIRTIRQEPGRGRHDWL